MRRRIAHVSRNRLPAAAQAAGWCLLWALVLAGCGGGPLAETTTGTALPSAAAPEESAPPGRFIVRNAGRLPPYAEGLRTQVDVPFTATTNCGRHDCTVPLDVLAPADGAALPTFVLVPGGPVQFHERRYLAELATALAREGAVVFLTTYRSDLTLNPEPDSFADVECAVRFARANAAAYGGDGDRVILVGKSAGSYLVLQSVLAPSQQPTHCLAEGTGVPDAVVGLAGLGLNAGRAPADVPPMYLVIGSDDPESTLAPGTLRRLEEAGVDAEYVELEGIDHAEMHDPQANPALVPLLMQVAEDA